MKRLERALYKAKSSNLDLPSHQVTHVFQARTICFCMAMISSNHSVRLDNVFELEGKYRFEDFSCWAGSLGGPVKKSSRYVPSFLPPSMASTFGKEEKAGQRINEVDFQQQSHTTRSTNAFVKSSRPSWLYQTLQLPLWSVLGIQPTQPAEQCLSHFMRSLCADSSCFFKASTPNTALAWKDQTHRQLAGDNEAVIQS